MGETRRGIVLGVRLALAHHPLCHHFRSDVWRVGVAFCSGCIVTWPLFVVTLVVAVPVLVLRPWALEAFLLGGLLGVPQLTTYLRRWSRAYRVLAKASGGIGLALFVAGGAMLGVPLWLRIGAGVALLAAFVGLQGLRMRSILRVCDACPWQRDWGRCPGFQQGAPREPPA